MRSLRTVALLIVIPVAGMAQLPQRDTRPVTPAGDSTISGRVMTSEGRPLARARVMLRLTGSDPSSARFVTTTNGVVVSGSNFWQHVTDASGQFTFANIPAGSYTLTASHGQYLAMQYGQKYVGQPGRPIELAAGQRLRADLVAVRGSAITGRIFDENGEPIDGVSVQAYRYSIEGKRRVIVPVGGRSYASNDIGQYRIAGLSPGDYLVAAIYRGNMEVVPDGVARQGYAPTWYPGAMQPAGAQKVRVMPGNDALNIDFTLMPTRMVQASGVVTSSSAASTPGNIQMWVTPVDNELAMVTRPTARVMQGGNFVVMDLTPGEYIFTAQMNDVTGMRQQAEMIGRAGRGNIDPRTLPPIRETEYGSLRVSVTGQPLENLSIQLRPGARVSVKFQSDQPMPPNRQFMLFSEDSVNSARPTIVGRDMDPVFSAGPGRYFPMMQLPDGWVLEKAVARGRDIRVSGLEITDNSPVELTIHLSSRGAMLSGTVAASGSGTPADYTLVALANDPADRTSRTGGVKTARPDQTGRFMLKGLRAGTYFVAAVDYADQNELYDPAFWARVEPHAIMVTVGAGEMKPITAPFISRR